MPFRSLFGVTVICVRCLVFSLFSLRSGKHFETLRLQLLLSIRASVLDNNNNIRAEFTTLLCNKVILDETIYIFINVTPDILVCYNILAMQRDTISPVRSICKSSGYIVQQQLIA